MKSYFDFGRKGKSDYIPFNPPVYDSIVDKTEFRPDSETTRQARLSGDTGSSVGSYDYDDGKITEDKKPSDVIIALRNNKLDKSDVQKLQAIYNAQAEKEIADSKNKKVSKRLQKVNNALLEAQEKSLGIEHDSSSENASKA